MKRAAILLLLAGCPAHKTTPPQKPDPVDPAALAELGLLMKNDINPAFSKLSFLVLHGDGEDDPAKLKTDIQTSAQTLRKGIDRLMTWQKPPTSSKEGRDVFYSFAASIDATLARFETALARDDAKTAADALDQMAKHCENCHHFFRVDAPMPPADVDPSPKQTTAPDPPAE